MLYSKAFIYTLKETPKEATITSHILMLRSGMIKKSNAGLYTYLPIGHKSLLKVIQIIRKEMDESGALEMSPTIVTPGEYWKATNRFYAMGKELARFKDRHGNDLVIGPTHEEAFTMVVKDIIQSYKQLPVNLYQIQTKFRDEIRPRFGVLRSREFIMKDAYSFGRDQKDLDESYQIMRDTYVNIFKKCHLSTDIVLADSGNMGGTKSEEFMVPSSIGEEEIIKCPHCDYVANQEKASSIISPFTYPENKKTFEKVLTPDQKTIEEVSSFLDAKKEQFIKSIFFKTEDKIVLACIRGDLEINEIKLKNALSCISLEMAEPEDIIKYTHANFGFVGPINLLEKVEIIVDESIQSMTDGICGANENNYHLIHVNYERDFVGSKVLDIHLSTAGERCMNCQSTLTSYRSIEVGHIFKLGDKYSKSLNSTFLDQNGKSHYPLMGCYGIGVARILAGVIEEHHDENGIIWPLNLAPYPIIFTLLDNAPETLKIALELEDKFKKENIEILIDDRKERPGVKLKDSELLGIPIRVIFGKKYLSEKIVEIKKRNEKDSIELNIEKLFAYLDDFVKEIK